MGQGDLTYFYGLLTEEFLINSSSWGNFPTSDNPTAKFKYFSIHTRMTPDLNEINRKTDTLLDWVAKVGGLYNGLKVVFNIAMTPYATYILKSYLNRQIVKVLPSKTKQNGKIKS